MIEFIDGDSNAFTAMAYGAPDPLTVQWCEQRSASFMQNIIPEAREFFTNTANTVFDSLAYNEISRMAKAMTRKLSTAWLADMIQPLNTIAMIQHAPSSMLPWIMAEPTIRDMYHRQELAGYDERYNDPIPKEINSYESPLYLAVHNGVYMPSEDGEDHVAVEYLGEFDQGTEHYLDLADQMAIMETWNHLKSLISKRKEDPTSAANAML